MKQGPGDYAGVVSRGVAFTIDAITAILVATVGFQVTIAVLAAVKVTDASFAGSGKALGYAMAVPVVFVVYCAASWALIGRTPGMMLMGVRVVTHDGSSPRFVRALIRALGYWVSAILMLGFIWIPFDRRRQGFHDKLARTFVVYQRSAEAEVVQVVELPQSALTAGPQALRVR